MGNSENNNILPKELASLNNFLLITKNFICFNKLFQVASYLTAEERIVNKSFVSIKLLVFKECNKINRINPF